MRESWLFIFLPSDYAPGEARCGHPKPYRLTARPQPERKIGQTRYHRGMAVNTTPYISFPGNARDVFDYYYSVFGGDLEILTYGEQLDSGVEFPFDPPRDAIAHGTLRGPFTLGGGDDLQNSRDRLTPGDIGFTVEFDSVEEAEKIYAALADGGDASMPFAKAPWGDYFGMVVDRFGVGFNITVPASASSLEKQAQRMIRAEGIDLSRAAHERAHDVAVMLRDFNAEFDTPCPTIDVLAERFERLLRRDDVVVCIADSGEHPVGFAFLTLRPSPYYAGPIAMLEELYVCSERRGQGIGTAIMDLVEAALSEAHVTEIQINVDEVDVDARRFYERRGFSHHESGQDYRMFCYIKELTRSPS